MSASERRAAINLCVLEDGGFGKFYAIKFHINEKMRCRKMSALPPNFVVAAKISMSETALTLEWAWLEFAPPLKSVSTRCITPNEDFCEFRIARIPLLYRI